MTTATKVAQVQKLIPKDAQIRGNRVQIIYFISKVWIFFLNLKLLVGIVAIMESMDKTSYIDS